MLGFTTDIWMSWFIFVPTLLLIDIVAKAIKYLSVLTVSEEIGMLLMFRSKAV